MGRKGYPHTIKYPIMKDIEYVSILKKKQSVFESDEGKIFEGMTRREFQIYLGERLPSGIYYHIIKFKNSDELYKGTIRVIKTGIKLEDESNMNDDITKEFKALKESIDKASKQGGISYEMLLTNVRAGYEVQINFLNQQIQFKDNQINKLDSECEKLSAELDDCEKESSKNSGLGATLDVVQKLLSARVGSPKAVTLKESNPGDIPQEILEILGAVDYSRINDTDMKKITDGLRQYITFLPLKGQ